MLFRSADVAQKAMAQVRSRVFGILKDRLGEEKANEIADLLTEGRWTHDYPIGCDEMTALGLPVCGVMPPEIYQLMDFFPQPVRRQPSVSYIPVPYEREKKTE